MRQKPLEEDDPFELKGVILPAQDETSLREMATCFVEEFLRDGWSDEQLQAMFKNPFYRGPYLVWRTMGDACVEAVIQQVRRQWESHCSCPGRRAASGRTSGTSEFRAGTVPAEGGRARNSAERSEPRWGEQAMPRVDRERKPAAPHGRTCCRGSTVLRSYR